MKERLDLSDNLITVQQSLKELLVWRLELDSTLSQSKIEF